MFSRAALIALAVAVLFPASALAAPPPNDNWANRTPLELPSQSSVADISSATTEASDPVFACSARSKGHFSLWYSFATGPETRYVTLSTAGSTFGGALLSVYEGSPGSFRLVTGGCVDGDARVAALSGLRLRPNTVYSIELAAEDGPLPDLGASLRLTEAPVYRVTTTLDGGGACTAGACTLRAAIDAANAAPGAVVVPDGHYTLDGPADEHANAGGDLDVQASIGIYGAGAGQTVIDAAHVDRVLHVRNVHSSVAVTGLTLRNGNTSGDGGALLGEPNVFVDLDGVSIESSHADSEGGGIAVSGGGRLVRSTVTTSTAAFGGAISVGRSGVPFEVAESTLAGNAAAFAGGGIASNGDLAIVNSTLSGNDGGGLLSGGMTTLRSVTVAGNTDSGRTVNGAGGIIEREGTVDVRDSVLADNLGGPDCARWDGALAAMYTHVEDRGSCDFGGAGNVTGSDPGLQPLADNGGPTRTQRVAIGSPLLDSGDPAGCKGADGALLATDQRGLARAVNGDAVPGARCDKGAAEKPDEAPVCTALTAETAEDTGAAVVPCHDPEGLALTYDGLGAAHGAFDGRLYRPALDYNGPDTLAFVAHDESNAVAGTVDVRVTAVNDQPVAHDDGGALELAAPGVLANDTDVEGDELTARVVTLPAHGTVLLAADGAYRYVPTPGFSGTDSFTYRARDAAASSAPATVTITVPSASVIAAPGTRPVVSKLTAVQHGRALRFTLSAHARTTVKLLRGKKRIKTYTITGKRGANTLRISLRRGRYTVQVTATSEALPSTTVSRKLTLGR